VEGLAVKRLLGLLGWLGVVLVLAAVVIRLTKPELQPWSQGFALAGSSRRRSTRSASGATSAAPSRAAT